MGKTRAALPTAAPFKDLALTDVLSLQVKQNDFGGRAHQSGRVRLDWRHLGGTRNLLRGGGHSLDRVVAARENFPLAQLIQPVSNGSLVLYLDTDFDGWHAARPGNH